MIAFNERFIGTGTASFARPGALSSVKKYHPLKTKNDV